MAFTLCADPERVRYQDMVGKRLRVECGFPALPGNVNTVVHHLESFEMSEHARMDWVAHACCVLAIVSRRSRTFFGTFTDGTRAKTQRSFRRHAETSTQDACAPHNVGAAGWKASTGPVVNTFPAFS